MTCFCTKCKLIFISLIRLPSNLGDHKMVGGSSGATELSMCENAMLPPTPNHPPPPPWICYWNPNENVWIWKRRCAKHFADILKWKWVFLVYSTKWKDTRFQMRSSCNRLIVHSLHPWHYDVIHDLANLSNHQNTFLWNNMKHISHIFQVSVHKSTFTL